MLEHSTLLVHPWTRTTLADGADAWIRPISDAASRPLGFVRLQYAPLSWLFWVRKLRLDVFETEDASHLLSVTRSWTMLSIWDVRDAEDRDVGRIYPKSLVASEGQALGYLERDRVGQGRILDPEGHALVRFGHNNAGNLELTFAAESGANPFVRMMMLGTILTLDPKPKRG